MSNVSLTVIGSGDAFSSGGRGNSCFFLQASLGILIDCGATALSGLKKQGISTDDIDVIVLTHFHGDHYAGLPFLLLDTGRLKRMKSLTVITPKGGKERLRQAMDLFYPGTSRMLDEKQFSFIEFNGQDKVQYQGLLVESFPVVHTKETLPHGIRISIDGIAIAYTGDTEWTSTIRDIVADADLAICECTFLEKEEKGHMNYKVLQQHLHELHCKRLLLTHFDEEMLQHLDEVKAECAYDGMHISITACPPGSGQTVLSRDC